MAIGGQYGGRKVREGVVVSDKMEKTVVVAVEANTRHRIYKKIIRRVRRFMAHDEASGANLGDRVRIVEGKPISRRKHWRVVEVLERAELPELAPGEIDLELLGEVKTEEEAAVASPQEAPPQKEAKAEEAPAAEAAVAEKAAEAEPVSGEETAEEAVASEEVPPAGGEDAEAESGEEAQK
jgi:small subunit ribosomal protein S17